MSETVTPWKFRVEGEAGLESDERTGAGPGWASDRGRGESDPAAVHGGVQAKDRSGGRRVQDARRGRGVVAAGGGILLAPHDVAHGAGGRGPGRGPPEKGGPAARRRSARPKAGRAGAGGQPMGETR